jgi:hypothetical protein
VAGVAVGERWFRVGPNGVRLVQLGAIGATLREPAFRAYMSANAVSVIGTWMQRTAIGWYAWELTASPFWLGMVAFADLFPAVFVGPFAGVLADRHDRRRIMLWTQGSLAVVTLVTALLIMAGQIGILGLVLLTGLKGCLIGVNQPARLALVPALVSRQNLPAAIALNSVVFNGARFVGPALAGLAIVASGVPAALIVNALSYVPLLFVLPRLALSEAVAPGAWQGAGAALKDGLRYIARSPVLGPLFAFFIALSLSVRPFGRPVARLCRGGLRRRCGGPRHAERRHGPGCGPGRPLGRPARRRLRHQENAPAATRGRRHRRRLRAQPQLLARHTGDRRVRLRPRRLRHRAAHGDPDGRRARLARPGDELLRPRLPERARTGALATGALAEAVGLRAAMLAAAAVFLVVYLWLQRRLMAGAAGE